MATTFGSIPMNVVCPNCGVTMTTKLSSKIPESTHLCACILCIFFFPCAWLPYCMSNDVIEHKCSACGATIGSYTPPSSETRSNITEQPTSFNDNSGFNDNFNHFIIHSDHSTHHSMTHHSDTSTRIDHDTSHSYCGDTGYSGGGDCGGGGGGDSGGGGGSCD